VKLVRLIYKKKRIIQEVNVQIRVQTLRDNLELLKPVVPKKVKTVKVVSNALLKDGVLFGTNLEAAVSIEIDPEMKGSALLPYAKTMELLGRVPGNANLVIEQKGKAVSLDWGSGKASFDTGDTPSEFPPIPKTKSELETIVDGGLLTSMLSTMSEYATTDDGRPVLQSVAMFLKEPLTLAGADGFRLAYKQLPGMSIIRDEIESALIPLGTIAILEHLVAKAPKEADLTGSFIQTLTNKRKFTISIDKELIQFKFGKIVVTSQLIQGTFPNVDQLIPTDFKYEVTVLGREMERALKSISGVAKEGSNIARLSWTTDKMEVTAIMGEESASMSISAVSETPGHVALNNAYILNYLKGKDAAVKLSLGESMQKGPVTFGYGTGPLVVIMPMFVSWGDEEPEPEDTEKISQAGHTEEPTNEVDDPGLAEAEPFEGEGETEPGDDETEQPVSETAGAVSETTETPVKKTRKPRAKK
jgi:DNA polymerase-3 subunit beta